MAAIWWANQRLQTPFQGFQGTEQFVEIPPGTVHAAIGRQLVDAGVVADMWTFRPPVVDRSGARLKAGEYRFEGAGHADRGRRRESARGESTGGAMTFPEGLTLDGDGRAVRDRAGFGTGRDFLTAAREPDADRGPRSGRAATSKAICFPTTYALSPHDTADAAGGA